MEEMAYESIEISMHILISILRLHSKWLVTRGNPVMCAEITIIFDHVSEVFIWVVLWNLYLIWVHFFTSVFFSYGSFYHEGQIYLLTSNFLWEPNFLRLSFFHVWSNFRSSRLQAWQKQLWQWRGWYFQMCQKLFFCMFGSLIFFATLELVEIWRWHMEN